MKPLKTAQQILVWFGLSFNDGESVSRNKKLARKCFAFIFSTIFVGTVLLSVITFLIHLKVSVEEFFIVFYQFSLTLESICGFITIFWFRKEISNIFESLSIICSKCKEFHFSSCHYQKFSLIFFTFSFQRNMMAIEDPSERLQKTNRLCERIYAFVLEVTLKWLSTSVVLSLLFTILRCQIQYGHIDVAHLYHPFTFRWISIHKYYFICVNFIKYFLQLIRRFHSLPWNQATLLGYGGEIFTVILNIEVIWIVTCQILILFIAICLYIFTFHDMFVSFVNHLKHSRRIEKKCNAIIKIVEFHIDIKRYGLFLRWKSFTCTVKMHSVDAFLPQIFLPSMWCV